MTKACKRGTVEGSWRISVTIPGVFPALVEDGDIRYLTGRIDLSRFSRIARSSARDAKNIQRATAGVGA
jgi:N-acyl-L-homoserine lactone synthetase